MAKKSEDDPITDDEYLLRRVFWDKFKTDRNPCLSPSAFEPRTKGRDPDVSGISLYREMCQDDPTDILNGMDSEKQLLNGVVRVSVKKLKELGFSIVSEKDNISGHVVIPELGVDGYQNDKGKLVAKILEICIEASRDENILAQPDKPT